MITEAIAAIKQIEPSIMKKTLKPPLIKWEDCTKALWIVLYISLLTIFKTILEIVGLFEAKKKANDKRINKNHQCYYQYHTPKLLKS